MQQASMDPNAMAQSIAQALAMQQQQQQGLSPEQIDQMLRTARPNQALIDALWGDNATPESRMQALAEYTQQIVANATAHAQVIASQYLQDYNQHVSPLLEDARYLSEQRFYGDLYEGHPGLKQFDPMVKQLLPQLRQQAEFPKERDKQASWVREQFIQQLKQAQPDFDPTRPPVVQQQQNRFQPQQQQPQQQQFSGQHQQPVQQQQPRQTTQQQTPPALSAGASGGAPARPPAGVPTGAARLSALIPQT